MLQTNTSVISLVFEFVLAVLVQAILVPNSVFDFFLIFVLFAMSWYKDSDCILCIQLDKATTFYVLGIDKNIIYSKHL